MKRKLHFLLFLVAGRLVDRTLDRGRLVEKIDQLQIDQEYLEDSGGEYL